MHHLSFLNFILSLCLFFFTAIIIFVLTIIISITSIFYFVRIINLFLCQSMSYTFFFFSPILFPTGRWGCVSQQLHGSLVDSWGETTTKQYMGFFTDAISTTKLSQLADLGPFLIT